MTGPVPTARRAGGEAGMILVNVLMFVAIASGVVMLMISREDAALHRAARYREAARAMAIVQGGELSAVAALRRDTAPASDNAAEPWAKVAQHETPVPGGSFSLAVADAQGRFNINQLMVGDSANVEVLRRMARLAGLPLETVPRAIELVRLYGPITDLAPLQFAGLDPATLRLLSGLVTALPSPSKVNVNAASEPLLALLLDDPDAARKLVEARERAGYLTDADFARAGVAMPTTAGFTSDFFWVRTRVVIGDTRQQRTALLARRRTDDDRVIVEPVGYWRGASPIDQFPPRRELPASGQS